MSSMRAETAAVILLTGVLPSALSGQSGSAWQLTPDARIGRDESFTRILAILPTSDGSVVIADDRNQELTVFARDGSFSRRIGGRGRGPGEFVRFRSVGLLGDTLWVIDAREPRTSLFSIDGTLLETVRNDSGAWLTSVIAGGALGSDSAPLGSIGVGQEEELPVILMTRSGESIDTVAWAPSTNWTFLLGPASDGSYAIGSQPFSDAGLTIVAPSGSLLYIVDRTAADRPDNAEFGVIALRVNGDTVWNRSYAYSPRPLEASRRDSLLNVREPPLLRAGYSRSQIRSELFMPDYYPPITSGFAGQDGTLWLRREEGGDTVDYWVLDERGARVGTLTVPENVVIMSADGEEAFGVVRDVYDVPTIVRYRIVRS